MDHEHSEDKAAEVLALRIILSCLDENVHSTGVVLGEALEACRGCDRCWMQLVKSLAAYAAAAWESVDFELFLTDESGALVTELSPEEDALRKEAAAALVANELAATLDGDES